MKLYTELKGLIVVKYFVMTEELPIRITSVFTLAEEAKDCRNNEIQESLNDKTEEYNPRRWQTFNEQLFVVNSAENDKKTHLNDLHCSSQELQGKLTGKQNDGKLCVNSETINNSNAKLVSLNTKGLDTVAISSSSAVVDNAATIFRVATDTCPSFCCKYNPVLIATLRAKAKTLNCIVKKP